VNSVNSANPLLSQATANGCTCVQFELTVADSNGISNATVSDTGIGVSGSTIDSWIETYGGSTKLAQAAITTTGSQTVTSAYTPAGNPTSLNLELGLGVNAAYQPGVFSLNTASVTFMGVTEPPPMLIFLSGFGGLLIIRHRRRTRAAATSAEKSKVSRRVLLLTSKPRNDWSMRSHA
jgi:hypothetical protein